jgi:hypothetical protein
MRKIVSKEEEEKRSKRNQLVVGGILILVMVASVLGYAFGREQKDTSTEKITYNGLEFTKTGNLWNTNTGSYQFSFLYNPEEAGKTNSALNQLSSYSNKPLYIYSENSEAGIEIYRNLFYQNQIVQRVQNACLEGEKCEDENYPIKNCTDNFIIIRENNQSDILNQNKSTIKQQNNCVFIEGNKGNLTQLSDSFLFKITGIQ